MILVGFLGRIFILIVLAFTGFLGSWILIAGFLVFGGFVGALLAGGIVLGVRVVDLRAFCRFGRFDRLFLLCILLGFLCLVQLDRSFQIIPIIII